MEPEKAMQTYESILSVTDQMVAAARAADWDRLVDLERGCRALTQSLVADSAVPPLAPEQQRRKAAIIHAVLANDAEIRNLVEPRMARLQELLGSTRNERKLARAYSPDGL